MKYRQAFGGVLFTVLSVSNFSKSNVKGRSVPSAQGLDTTRWDQLCSLTLGISLASDSIQEILEKEKLDPLLTDECKAPEITKPKIFCNSSFFHIHRGTRGVSKTYATKASPAPQECGAVLRSLSSG